MSNDYRSPEQPEITNVGGYEFETFNETEAEARRRALPKRKIISCTGHLARLECGHPVSTYGVLKEGDSAPCRACYEAALQAAERMIGEEQVD